MIFREFLHVIRIEHPSVPVLGSLSINNVHVEEAASEVEITNDDIDIKALLKFTIEGKILLGNALLSVFTDEDRSRLADILIGHELIKDANDNRLSKDRLEYLATKIVETFPFENKMNWIYSLIHPNKIVVKGKLIRRYNTWMRVTKCGPIKATLNDALPLENISFESDIEEGSVLEVSLMYLRNAIMPWSVIEDLWKKTMKIRLENLYAVNDGIYNYFKTYPCLKEPLGFTLLEEDFKFLYPAAKHNLFAEWPKLSLFVEGILKRKDPGILNGINSPKVRLMKILMHLSEIFPVITAMNKVGVGSWRPSQAESQDAFLLVIKATEDLQPVLQHRSEKLLKFDLNLQPVPVVLGSVEKFAQCFIILDTATYEVENPLKAIDLTFKIFHSLHIPYPPECEQIWTFLQQAVYKIHTNRDKKFPGCSELVSQYMDFILTHNTLFTT